MPGRLEETQRNMPNADLDLEPIESESDDYDAAPREYRILTYPADYTLEVLHEKWRKRDIEIPDFQRQFVWSRGQASKLIESFLVGLPVPAIYLFTDKDTQKYLVIDGQQRLKSVFYFFEGYFGPEEEGRRQVFRLTNLNERSKWRDKAFVDFDAADKRRLQNSVLRAFIVQQLDPADRTSIYHVFERLNTGGTLLTNQEIRNCVYRGTLNRLLVELNRDRDWRRVLGKPQPDSRQRDVELILRFFAMMDISNYEKPLKDFLSNFMQRERNPVPASLDQMRHTFQMACQTVVNCLGEKPFHLVAGLRPGAFDAVMVAFAKNLEHVPTDILERYKTLAGEDKFLSLTRNATTDVETVKTRFALAQKRLFS